MKWIFSRQFSRWDIIAIIMAALVLAEDITMIPETLILGVLWMLAGATMKERMG